MDTLWLTQNARAEDDVRGRRFKSWEEPIHHQKERQGTEAEASYSASQQVPLWNQSISKTAALVDPVALMAWSSRSSFTSLVHSWDDIVLPTREQSMDLIRYGKLWTSWIHCAVYYPDFEATHDGFWRVGAHESLRDQNPSWLAIYFALLAVRPRPHCFGLQACVQTDQI